VNGICGCGLPAHWCQPAVAGGIIYADLRGELSTHLSLQALFTQSSPVREPLLQAFPFQAHWGRWHCTRFLRPVWLFTAQVVTGSSPFFSGVFLLPPILQDLLLLITGQCCCSCQPQCLFTAHVGGGSYPLSCGVFLPPPLSQAFLLLVAGCVTGSHRYLSSKPGLFIYSSRKDSLPQSSVLSVLHTLSPASLFFLLIITVSLFPPGGCHSTQGLWCSGPGLSVGVPVYL
jgi:hypothetical protein